VAGSGLWRRLAPFAVVLGAVGSMTATAGAAGRPPAQVASALETARFTFVQSLPPVLRDIVPHPAGARQVPPGTTLFLNTDPTSVSFGSVNYQMQMSAFTQTQTFGVPPTFEVALDRLSSAGGQVMGEQEHVYSYASTGIGMTATQGLKRLRLNTHRSVAPTRVNTTFRPTQSASFRCRLVNGGTGISTEATGVLHTKAFRIATGTSPVFGVIRSAPRTAFAFDDPGCGAPVGNGPLLAATSAFAYHPTCAGRETIQAGDQFAQTSWLAQVGFGGRHAAILVQTSSTSVTETQAHLAVGVEPGADMPPAHHSETGATAVLQTEGNPLFTGSSFFFSHQPPKVSPVKTCTYEGHLHRFVASRYVGGMINTSGSPLAALFDTGTMQFVPRAAALTVRHYLS
jgi:hypothetical protein